MSLPNVNPCKSQNYLHFGVDLSGCSDELNNIYGIMSNIKDMTALKTTSNDTRKAFIVGGNNSLNDVTLKKICYGL